MDYIADEVPEINYYLIRKKYEDLKKGKDDLTYIEEEVQKKKKHKKLLQDLQEKYNYKTKKIINPKYMSKEKLEELKNSEENFIIGFESQIQEQIKNKQKKVSKFELLRSHIKNYQMLTEKEKKTVLGYIGALSLIHI